MLAKAPALAWLLAAPTGFLVGLALAESRHQTVAFSHPAGTDRRPASSSPSKSNSN